MRLSRLLVPPLKKLKEPTSVDLLAAHGFVHKAQSGVYDILPLGLRVQRKIEHIIRKHMNAVESNELALSSLVDPQLWQKSGRLDPQNPGEFMFSGKQMLAPTGEEQITTAVGPQSYKVLPLSFYQITRKYRDELRPKSGLLRTREFTMKDAYTFDVDKAAAMRAYQRMTRAYEEIFKEIGVPVVVAAADPGNMGGNLSHEYQLIAPLGEDTVLNCPSCGSTSNIEVGRTCECKEDLVEVRGIEVAHTFYLGTRYTDILGSRVNLATGESAAMEMGCYGIGISRLVGAIADSLRDSRGLLWPMSVAPAHACVVGTNVKDCEAIASELCGQGVDAVAEDRTTQLGHALRAGREAGWPILIVLGRDFKDGLVEIESRNGTTKVPRGDLASAVQTALAQLA